MITVKTLENETIGSEFWEPMITSHEALNTFFSKDYGIPRGTATMIYGDPGVGKSTVTMNVLTDLQEQDYNVLFISAEMRKTDVAYMTRRMPRLNKLPVWYVDYTADNIVDSLEIELMTGDYDLVVVDSWKQFNEIAYALEDQTKKGLEARLINMLQGVMEEEYTTFFLIQQITKSGDFAGSKQLEHLVTSAVSIRYDGKERYLEFQKNRRGETKERLYFQLTENGVSYDGTRLENERDAYGFAERENKREQENMSSIDDIINSVENSEPETTSPENNDESGGAFDEFDIMTDLDKDVAETAYQHTGGNISATHRTLKNEGHIPDDVSRYYVEKFLKAKGVV